MKDIELPPLPPACGAETLSVIGWGYTEDDMQAYARAAVEANSVPDARPMFWVRLCSDGMYEGPIHDKQLEDVRRHSGAWTPLYLGASPAPAQQKRKPMTDENDRALCEAYCNTASDEYFKARPQLDSEVNRRIFYAGHRKAWIEWPGIHGIKE